MKAVTNLRRHLVQLLGAMPTALRGHARVYLAMTLLLGLAAFALATDNSDPFAAANRMRPELTASSKKLRELIDFTVKVDPPQAKPGDIIKITITGKLKPGYHTYPLTQRAPDQSTLSKITIEGTKDVAPLWPYSESPPRFVPNQINEIDLEHDKDFTWSQELVVLPSAEPGLKHLDVLVYLQVCDLKSCFGPAFYPPPGGQARDYVRGARRVDA